MVLIIGAGMLHHASGSRAKEYSTFADTMFNLLLQPVLLCVYPRCFFVFIPVGKSLDKPDCFEGVTQMIPDLVEVWFPPFHMI